MAKDYYELLGVSKSATDDEIKKAYRKMALQYHPDRNKDKDASSKFKEVTHAYEVLSDPQKKQTYDQFGAQAFEQGGPSGQGAGNPFAGGFGGQQGGQYGPFTYTYSSSGGDAAGGFDFGGFSDPFEIFEQFFGGGFSQRARRPAYSLTIDFMDAVKGATKHVTIDGKQETIKIPSGVNDGSRIRFDKYDVLVRVQPSAKFQREGDDIITEEEIPFSAAALGTELEIETVEEKLKVRVTPGTQPGTVIRLRGKGVQHIRGNGRGDHYIKIKIVIPKHLNSRQKELLREFDSAGSKKGWF